MRTTNRAKVVSALALVATFIIVAPEPVLAPTAQAVTLRTQTTPTIPHLPAAIVAAWTKVAWCETHADWHRNMPTFDGGLGISRVVWLEVGGTDYAPAPHLASIEDQIRVAQRIQTRGGVAGYVPDQNGCNGSW